MTYLQNIHRTGRQINLENDSMTGMQIESQKSDRFSRIKGYWGRKREKLVDTVVIASKNCSKRNRRNTFFIFCTNNLLF